MIIQVRTSRDLLDTMRLGLSPAWKVTKASLARRGTNRVHVVNWDGTMRIEGDYAADLSIEDHPDHPAGRTIIAFANPRLVLCSVQFDNARNPVAYLDLEYEEQSRSAPSYQPGPWPAPSRDEAQELYDN